MQFSETLLAPAKELRRTAEHRCRVALLSLVAHSADCDEELHELLELLRNTSRNWRLERVLVSDVP